MRRVITLALLVMIILLAITGLTMTFASDSHDQEVKAARTPAALASASRGEPEEEEEFFPLELHQWSGYALLVLMPIHLAFNWCVLRNYLGLNARRKQAEAAVSAGGPDAR